MSDLQSEEDQSTVSKTQVEIYNPNQVTLSIVSTKSLSEGRLELSVSHGIELQMEDVVLKDPKRQKCQKEFQPCGSSTSRKVQSSKKAGDGGKLELQYGHSKKYCPRTLWMLVCVLKQSNMCAYLLS